MSDTLALDERVDLVRELHHTSADGLCAACGRQAPCPTIRVLNGRCPCPGCGMVPPTPHRRRCGR